MGGGGGCKLCIMCFQLHCTFTYSSSDPFVQNKKNTCTYNQECNESATWARDHWYNPTEICSGTLLSPKRIYKILWDSCDSLHPCTQCLHTHINMHAYKHTYIHNCNQSWEIQRWKASAHQSQFRQRSSNFYNEPIGSYLTKLVMFQNQLPTLNLKLF